MKLSRKCYSFFLKTTIIVIDRLERWALIKEQSFYAGACFDWTLNWTWR